LEKCPPPQLGILIDPNEKTISELKEKINSSVRIRTKEASIKLAIGKENMKDEEIIENITSVYDVILRSLPREK